MSEGYMLFFAVVAYAGAGLITAGWSARELKRNPELQRRYQALADVVGERRARRLTVASTLLLWPGVVAHVTIFGSPKERDV